MRLVVVRRGSQQRQNCPSALMRLSESLLLSALGRYSHGMTEFKGNFCGVRHGFKGGVASLCFSLRLYAGRTENDIMAQSLGYSTTHAVRPSAWIEASQNGGRDLCRPASPHQHHQPHTHIQSRPVFLHMAFCASSVCAYLTPSCFGINFDRPGVL